MSAGKHTPGPLHVEDGEGRLDDDGDWNSLIVVSADNETVVAELLWCRGDAEAETQTRADAALFAAAPALAEALEALRWKDTGFEEQPPRFCDHAADPCDRCDAAAAALRAAGRLP